MKQYTLSAIILSLLLVIIVSGCTNNTNPAPPGVTPALPSTNNQNVAPPSTANPNSNFVNPVGQNLADSRFANDSYLISGDTLDAATVNAISGFQINKTANSDGTTTIILTSSNPEYQNQTYTLQPGQKLYFIEMNLADDSNDNDNIIGDDRALITDADDNIIAMPNTGQERTTSGGGFGNLTADQRLQLSQEMVDACNGRSENDSCTVMTPRGQENGTCIIRNETLTCAMQRGNFTRSITPQ